MDQRFNTQAGIYELLEQADRVPGIFDVRIGHWLAWPAIKVLIYARLFNALDDAPMASPQAKRMFTGASLLMQLPSTWMRLRSALSQLPPITARPRVAWLSGAYTRRTAAGAPYDAIFDELPSTLSKHVEHIWLDPPVVPPGTPGVHAEQIYEVATDLSNQLTSLQRFRPAVRSAAQALGEKLTAVTPSVGELSWTRVCLDALSMFEARRTAWTSVFSHLKPSAVLMTNAPYLSGEVAAAKTSGAVVGEFQHGLFGPRCPEYGWPGSLASQRRDLPVADRFFVFGDLFRAGALKNKFWQDDEVRVVGSPDVERRRQQTSTSPSTNAPRIVFLTQPTTRDEAIAFWSEYLRGVDSGEFSKATLTIKIHPSDRHDTSAYATLCERFPALCAIAASDQDAARVILEHDLVVGYTSFALIEAVGLGRATVSISGAQAPGGVFALCPIAGAADAMPVVSTPAEFASAVSRWPQAQRPDAAHGFFARHTSDALLQAAIDFVPLRQS